MIDGAASPSDGMHALIAPSHPFVWEWEWRDRGWSRHGTAVGLYGGADRSMAASDCMAVPMGAWLDG
jgi:hypothetical protein